MKRIFLLSLFAICVINLCAQHIKFMGIPLGQPLSVIHQQLKQKGFVYEMNTVLYSAYKGDFWKYRNVGLTAQIEGGIVTSIMVDIDAPKSTPGIHFNELVGSMNKKYGKYYIKRNNTNYIWKVIGGCINVWKMDKHFLISYYDRTSDYYMSTFHQRNYEDDL